MGTRFYRFLTTSKECWLGLGTLTLLFVAAVIGILLRLQPVQHDLKELESARARTRAAQQLELSAVEYGFEIHQFVGTRDPRPQLRVIERLKTLRGAVKEYERHAAGAPRGETLAKVTTQLTELENLGEALVQRAQSQAEASRSLEPGPREIPSDAKHSEELAAFEAVRGRVQAVLKNELGRESEADYQSRLDATVWQGLQIERFALILLIAGTTVALLTSATVGRAVSQSERRGDDARQFADNIVETVRQPLVVLDSALRVVRANDAFYKTFDLRPDETSGRRLEELGRGDWDDGRLQSLLDDVLSGRRELHDLDLEIDFPRAGRRITRLTARGLQSRRNEGLLLLALDDVTDRERAERAVRESRELLRSVLDSVPQKISTSTPSGDWNYLNPQWTEYTGLSLEQIRQGGWTQVIHPDDVADNLDAWAKSISSGTLFQFEHRIRRDDGQFAWHISRALPVRDPVGNIVMWVGSATDIDQQRESADRLRQLSADLASAHRRKDEFLAMLAHELRNPLAPIGNAVEVLRRGGLNESMVQNVVDVMGRQLAHMVRLIDDLLDVSRVSQGKIDLRKSTVELATIVSHGVEASRTSIENAGLSLIVTLSREPIYVHADATRMAQVIGNLLNNAAKFTPSGGTVSLLIERDGDHAVIRVRDTGVGIAPDQLRHVFDMFMQGDTTLERTKGGLGIGLTLAKRLVELHDGSVDALSGGVNRGTELVVRIPLVDAPAVETPSTPPTPLSRHTTFQPRRVLVVDDNQDSAESLELLLTLSGHDVRLAHDGLEAVDVAATFQPDVVLLDIGLPKLNGYEAARQIRELAMGRRIKLVALTGFGRDTDRQRSAESGFDLHLVKPVDHQALLKAIADL